MSFFLFSCFLFPVSSSSSMRPCPGKKQYLLQVPHLTMHGRMRCHLEVQRGFQLAAGSKGAILRAFHSAESCIRNILASLEIWLPCLLRQPAALGRLLLTIVYMRPLVNRHLHWSEHEVCRPVYNWSIRRIEAHLVASYLKRVTSKHVSKHGTDRVLEQRPTKFFRMQVTRRPMLHRAQYGERLWGGRAVH
jgi:hypothetical protein